MRSGFGVSGDDVAAQHVVRVGMLVLAGGTRRRRHDVQLGIREVRKQAVIGLFEDAGVDVPVHGKRAAGHDLLLGAVGLAKHEVRIQQAFGVALVQPLHVVFVAVKRVVLNVFAVRVFAPALSAGERVRLMIEPPNAFHGESGGVGAVRISRNDGLEHFIELVHGLGNFQMELLKPVGAIGDAVRANAVEVARDAPPAAVDHHLLKRRGGQVLGQRRIIGEHVGHVDDLPVEDQVGEIGAARDLLADDVIGDVVSGDQHTELAGHVAPRRADPLGHLDVESIKHILIDAVFHQFLTRELVEDADGIRFALGLFRRRNAADQRQAHQHAQQNSNALFH